MRVPLSWLKDYVDIEIGVKEFAESMTMSGSKVEAVEALGEEISNVVVGRITALEKHPDADRLQVSQVDIGTGVVQIVTGAQNVSVGDLIPVAVHGAKLPGGKIIKKSKLRGVESNGMMCSIQELGLSREDYPEAAEDGIFILKGEYSPGQDIKEALNLNETVIEFEITPNRPDCLSMEGIAREAAVTLNKDFRKPEFKVLEEGDNISSYVSIEVEAPDLCPRYSARVVKDVKIGPSPDWMQHRLKAAGVRPINNIVDVTNYVMLELGQPMHAFDLENLTGRKIIVRRAKDWEVLKTLDDQERKLDSSMLVIADENRPVGIAGVMGGANSEITENTKTILLESANFNGTSIRLTAKKLGMRTEASSRFEKGLDLENTIRALERTAQLIEQMGAGVVCKGIIDCYPEKRETRKVKFRPDAINSLLGTSIDQKFMVDVLTALEFEVDEKEMTVTVPSFRQDVEREADLAEEVARFYGYNNIEATLLAGKAFGLGKRTYKQKIEDMIKDVMIATGFYEVCTYSFTSPKVFDAMRLPEDSRLRNAVKIINPLGEDYSIMRTSTIPDMLKVISTNFSRRVEAVKFFELSSVYIADKLPLTELPEERLTLTLGLYGGCDFYDLKGAVEELLDALGIRGYGFEPLKDNPSFHPGRTAKLVINGRDAGVLGEIHPEVAEEFDCPERTYIGVIEVKPLIDSASLLAQYMPLPKFPAVTRDIALLISDDIMVKSIEEIIYRESGKIIESVKLFDIYKGKQVPEGMKSVAYSLAFRASDRTLTDDEVNKVMAGITGSLKKELGAQLRE